MGKNKKAAPALRHQPITAVESLPIMHPIRLESLADNEEDYAQLEEQEEMVHLTFGADEDTAEDAHAGVEADITQVVVVAVLILVLPQELAAQVAVAQAV